MVGVFLTLAAGLLLAIILPILSFLRATESRAIARNLERRLGRLEARLEGLDSRTPRAEARQPGHAPDPGPAVAGESSPPETAPAATGADPPSPVPIAPPAPPASSPEPSAQPAAAGPSGSTPFDGLETRIGSRWMLYVGVATLVVGISLLVRHAFQNEWVTETMRVAIGGASGAALIVAGARFTRGGLALFGQMLTGGGLAALYVSTYAALAFYSLIPPTPAFVVTVAVTGLAATLADRQRSQGLALMAVGGGFVTPFLVGGPTRDHLTLFTYVAILIGGTMFLARRREWPGLNVASFLLTCLTIGAWGDRFYRDALYLPTELFLTAYCAMFLFILYRTQRLPHRHAPQVGSLLWAAPILYHGASCTILARHSAAFLVYLIAFTAIGLLAMVRWQAYWPRLALWAGVSLPMYGFVINAGTSWLWPAIVTLVAIYGMHMAAQLERVLVDRHPLHPADVVLTQANGLGLYVGLFLLIEPRFAAFSGGVAAALAVWHGGVAVALGRVERSSAAHVLGVGLVLLAVAIAVQLDGVWVTVLWAGEAAVVTAIGLRERRDWMRAGGAVLLVLAIAQVLQLLAAPVPSSYAILFNQRVGGGGCVIAVLYLAAWLHRRARPDARASLTEATVGVIAANVLTLVVLTAEINAFWLLRGAQTSATTAELARQVTLSVIWAIYAAALIGVGIVRRYPQIRYLAIVVFGITVLKVFAVDLARLSSVYRILSTMGLGLLLVMASYLYHRFRSQLAA